MTNDSAASISGFTAPENQKAFSELITDESIRFVPFAHHFITR